MLKIAGVKFPYSLKLSECHYDENLALLPRDLVVISGGQGEEVAQVVFVGKKEAQKKKDILGEIIRKATEEDLNKLKELENEAKSLFPIFAEKIRKHNLKMKPLGVSYSLDQTRAIFLYTADGRVDFRELARDLSRTIKKQSVLKQIGSRDEAKIIGGYGRCGLPICCATFMTDSLAVSMSDAELAYGFAKNANKISGLCGRLMCCIGFESEEKKVPKKRKKDD